MIEILNRWTKAVVYRSEKSESIGTAAKEAILTGAVLTDAVLRRADLSNSNCGTALGDFLRITGTSHPICAIDEENVSIGCMRNSLAWWSEHYADTGQSQGYSAKQIEEYRLHIEYVATWMSARKQAVRS